MIKKHCPSTINTLLGFIFLLCTGFSLSAQNPVVLYGESEFDVGFDSGENWSHTFGIADRYLFSEYYDGEQVADFGNEHLELNHFTKYKATKRSAFSLGVRYRFREAFDDNRYDELRLVEQYEFSHPGELWGLSHRVRAEQRLYTLETIHRFRYRFKAEHPINDVLALQLNTEALLSISPQDTPGLEQRFGIGIENESFENLSLSLGLQYELEDYNKSPEHEIFLLTGVSLKL